MARIRLLIADYAMVRLAVRMALESEAEICAEAEDAEQAVIEAERTQPDLCLVGWEIPGEGIAAVRGILRVAPNTSVIVLADVSNARDLLAAVRAGAIGYVPGSISSEQLRRVVRAVAAQEAAVPRSMVRDLMVELRTAARRRAAGVTDREAEVLAMLQHGQSTAEIARALRISPVTVRRHISDLIHKLGVGDRTDLARMEDDADAPVGPA